MLVVEVIKVLAKCLWAGRKVQLNADSLHVKSDEKAAGLV